MNTRLFQRLSLGAILFSAAALLLLGSWYSYTSTFDTGTVGLMSVNIVNGDRPLFFYGQPYFGALEAYLAAVFIFLFGFSEFVVSLSPISFTLAWIFFSYLLFSRIHSRTAGLIAAACTAFPGYYVFWYSISTYGGYSAILCIGTTILWLSLKVLQENLYKAPLVFHASCIGILMGLGIWIHPLVFPYIVISACIFGLFVLKERFRSDIVFSLGLAVGFALSGFLPFYFETGSFFGGISEPVQLSWMFIVKALYNLFFVNSYELVVWNFTHTFESSLIRYLALYSGILTFCIALLLAAYSLVLTKKKLSDKKYYLVPFAFCLLFLTMYVQHHMATIKAPRYAIGFLCMLFCIIWSLAIIDQKKRSLKIVSWSLFCFWIVYQVTGTVLFITANISYTQEERNMARDIVTAAHDNNLTSVVTYGDPLFGLKGQKFSMYSQNKIAFAHADKERYQKNAQWTETDFGKGYLVTEEYKKSLENTLKGLGVSFTVEKVHNYFLFSHLQLKPQFVMQVIPGEDVKFVPDQEDKNDRIGELLGDRSQDVSSELTMLTGKALSFDTGRLRNLCGLWMFPFQDPSATEWTGPGRYEVYFSVDGSSYDKIYSSLPHTGNGFHAGPNIYIGGAMGKVETLFAPVDARYVRIVFLDKSPSPITELYIFQTDGTMREDSSDDIAELTQLIVDNDLDFVFADRWLSARLLEEFKGTSRENVALYRHSTKYKNAPLLHYFVKPEKGKALICDISVADECEKTLVRQYGESVISGRFDLQNYSLFSLVDAEISMAPQNLSALLWNGHLPIQTKDMTLLAPWFNAVGLPVWRADFTKTSGVYHDSWTNGEGLFYDLDYTIDHEKDKEVKILTHGWRPNGEMSSLNLTLIANDKISLEFKKKEQNTYIFSIPDTLNRLNSLEIKSAVFTPPGQDSRRLGIDIKRIEIQ